MNRIRFVTHVFAALALAFATASCTRTEDTAGDRTAPTAEPGASGERVKETARVRFVNAYGSAVDLYFGDTPVFTAVAPKSVTSYQQVEEDWAQFRLRPAGQPNAEPLATNIESVGDGEQFTVIGLAKEDGKATLRAIQDDERPVTDKAKVRFVHGAQRMAHDIDIVATGQQDPLFDDVNPNSVSNYKEIDPVKGGLEIRSEDGKRRLHRVPNSNLEPGRLYTFVMMDGKAQGALDVIRLTDQAQEAAGGGYRK